jgi:hypothetical protein
MWILTSILVNKVWIVLKNCCIIEEVGTTNNDDSMQQEAKY